MYFLIRIWKEQASFESLAVWEEKKEVLIQGPIEITEIHCGMNIKQNPRKLSRTKSGLLILKLTKYHIQMKTNIEAIPPIHIPVKQIDFKDKDKSFRTIGQKYCAFITKKILSSDFLIATHRAK